MTSERYQQVGQLYRAALEIEAEQRGVFLAEACGGDEYLRREVESLLGYEAQSEGLIDRSALEVTARALAADTQSLVSQQIDHYQILSLIGRGGMAEVYLARDTKLERQVALKVLPTRFTQNKERLRRFVREAKAASALNHPNIITIHEIGRIAETHYLVTEFIDGETLRQHFTKGRIVLPTALEIALQVGSAMTAAHEAGIVHRDLKPENVMLRPDGLVKVLDFGLAKLTERQAPPVDIEGSTITTVETETGVVMGSVGYMSPEQARGQKVDSRTDIFSLGVMLYEMVAGRRPFEGKTSSDVIAAILTTEPPPFIKVTPGVPRELEQIIGRALRKDREERYQVVKDLLADLRGIKQHLVKNPRQRLRDIGDPVPVFEAERLEGEPQTAGSPRWLPWSVAAVCALALAVALWAPWRSPATGSDAVSRWFLNAENSVVTAGFDLSRDGRRLVYSQREDSQKRLWVRDLSQPETRPIVGTENGSRPFFSPDGQWFAFFSGRARGAHLRKVPVAGGSFNTRGAAITLCDNATYYGGSWGEDNQIIFSGQSGLMRVNASGGPCEAISKANPSEGDHRWPQILPGGNRVLFTIGIEGAFHSARIAVLDLNTGNYRIVLEGGANARYVPSGHLVFVRGGELFAVPFDLDRLQVNGVSAVVVESIQYASTGGYAAYTFTDTGLLLYATHSLYEFEWRDRRGITQPVSAPPVFSLNFRLSPDGTRVALTQSGRGDIAILTLDKGVTERVTSEGTNGRPIWSADGRAITFRTLGKGIFRASLDGGGLELLTEHAGAPADWASDRKTLLYYFGDPFEIWTLTLQEDGNVGERRQLLAGSNIAYWDPDVSPDGRWLAYVSNESGQPQVYVRPFPGPGNKVIISKDTGLQPRWSPDGRELFYYVPETRSVMEVDVLKTSPEFRASSPQKLLSSVGQSTPLGTHFDVDPTGQRFLVIAEARPEQLNLVTNWFEELRQKGPTKH
jgi:serine/threonine protein kinase